MHEQNVENIKVESYLLKSNIMVKGQLNIEISLLMDSKKVQFHLNDTANC